MGRLLTVTQLQQRIATEVDQRASTPTVGGNEWEFRLTLLNRAQDEWSMAHDWESLRKTFWPLITYASMASVSLPSNFKELAAPPIKYDYVEGGRRWNLIKQEEQDQMLSTDEYALRIGNPMVGYTLLWNPPLESGASVKLEYYSFPTSLASPNDYTEIEEPEFLVKRTAELIWRARNDVRAEQARYEARELLNMARENDNTQAWGIDDRVQTQTSINRNFRIGRD